MRKLLIIIAVLLTSITAHAGLVLHISPDGATGTRWEFSGSTVAVSSGSNNSFWGEGSGTLESTNSGSHSILTGSGTLSSTSGGTQNVINVWASTHNFDGIAPRVGTISWNAGDVLSWNGNLTSDLLFADFNLGSISTNNILGTNILESLTITVSNTRMNTVPEPATMMLFSLCIAGFAFSKRRKYL